MCCAVIVVVESAFDCAHCPGHSQPIPICVNACRSVPILDVRALKLQVDKMHGTICAARRADDRDEVSSRCHRLGGNADERACLS
jgi:hypothetical protein